MNAIQATPITKLNAAGTLTTELFRRFISFCDVKPQSLKAYTVALQRLFAFFQENGIRNPDTDDIIRFKAMLEARYTPCTVSLYMTACRLFFRWTAQRGYYANIADHVKGAKINRRHKKDALTTAQVKAVFNSIPRSTLAGKRDYAIFATMTACGLRDIEVSRANIEDLRTGNDCTVLFIHGKGRDEKEPVAILPEVENAIRDYLTARSETDRSAPLFTSVSNNSTGARLTTRSISRIVKSHLQSAGYNSDRLTAHSLRHTAITLSLLAGNTIQETQAFARHSDIATTAIYAHNIEEMTVRTQCGKSIAAAIF